MVGDKPTIKVFNCGNCGAGITLRAPGQTVSVACSSCGSVIDATNENYRVLSKSEKYFRFTPVIPLGQRGTLHGALWEVIGFMRRRDGSGVYGWSEYLLFNPTRGFRWLVEFDGHWNYVVTTKTKPEDNYGLSKSYMGKEFFLFHKGTARVTYVVGEFYWRVKVGEKVAVEDYISPPEILSLEKSKDEAIWSIGEYVDAEHIRSAFQITEPMPAQEGVAPNQISTVSSLGTSALKYWGVFALLLVVMQMIAVATAGRDKVYQGGFSYQSSDVEKVKTSPQFELRNGTANVEFALFSPVENEWLEVQIDLVNDETGETYEFEQGVEYYSGYDSDGYWTEGDRFNYKRLSSIPAGKYHLNVEASAARDRPYEISVTRDVVTWSNFLWAFLLLAIFPIIAWWRSRRFELARWSTSDFSPYWSHRESEDESE